MKRWPFVLALAMLGGSYAFLASRSSAEPTLIREPFSRFPLQLGEWQGRDLEMDEDVLDLLNLSDHLMRAYSAPRGDGAGPGPLADGARQDASPVWMYVGYYGSQRTGATYHSPKNCLPGGGWQFRSAEAVAGVIPGAPEARVNRVVIEKGLDRQVILYWYQDRGRVVASEYAAKVHLIWDAMTTNRTDGSLVRISTPVVGSEDDAYRHAVAFVEAAWEPLTRHLPG